jgi:Sugar phosphate isomerases/epimerases
VQHLQLTYVNDGTFIKEYNRDKNKKYLNGNRLMAIHLHDNGGARGQHQLPFDGNICWPAVMKKISETAYNGATALEPMNWGYENLSIQEFLSRAYEKAKELEKMRLD